MGDVLAVTCGEGHHDVVQTVVKRQPTPILEALAHAGIQCVHHARRHEEEDHNHLIMHGVDRVVNLTVRMTTGSRAQ